MNETDDDDYDVEADSDLEDDECQGCGQILTRLEAAQGDYCDECEDGDQ